jgi:hypothetical protein
MSSRKEVVTPYTPYDDLPQYLTIRQLASWSQQSDWSIREAIRDGRIPATKRFGRKLILIAKDYFNPSKVTAPEQAVGAAR